MSNQETPMLVLSKIVDKQIEKIELLEKIALGIFGLGILIFYTNAIVYVMAFGGILLSMSYFLLAFRTYKFEDSQESESILQSQGMILFLSKLNYLAFSIGSVGLLFAIASIAGSEKMVSISIITLVTSTGFLIASKSWQENHVLGKGLLIRNMLFLIALGMTLLV
ncbi:MULTISPECIES: hypothetical protein [unclassified Lentimicrobium]|uniref:hypothetical protein n=1 Tax=unclassified Lentimicrobium TaxID=2677434 RepID=UPI0015537FBC|nr:MULTISPECIES: hypothetical protein [unclassified Lentimicrobium]NPD45373.1 hypothetical protein [Lentimicrobium sp. S6]NPD85260.1 hypothetical protein [Lentimicrobium sp. L6]